MADGVLYTNPNARGNLRDRYRIGTLNKITGNHFEVVATKNLDELVHSLQDLAAKRPGIILLDGGDGTQYTFFSLLAKIWPKEMPLPYFGLIPGGTWNIAAQHLGMKPKRWKKYIQNIVKKSLEELTFEDMHLMKILDNTGLETYGFSFGVGLPVHILDEYYTKKEKKALQLAFMLGKFAKSAPVRGNFYQRFAGKEKFIVSNGDGQEKEVNLLGLMAQTVPGLGLPWSKPFYKATNTEKFHVLGTEWDIGDVLAAGPAIYTGNLHLLRPEGWINMQSGGYKLRTKNGKIVDYDGNGEREFMGQPLRASEWALSKGMRAHVAKDM